MSVNVGGMSAKVAVGPEVFSVVAGRVETDRHDLVFDGFAPWSRAWRAEHSSILEWKHGLVKITASEIRVDSGEPDAFLDCFHNPIASVAYAWHGRPSFHAFTASTADASVAIMGASGQGKSTTGLALLERGFSLVNDDLLALDDRRPLAGRPFVRRLPVGDEEQWGLTDVGGKFRVPAAVDHDAPPLRHFFVLTDDLPSFEPIDDRAAFALLLENPYLPVPMAPGEARARFEVAAELVRSCAFVAVRPKSLDPASIAARIADLVG